MQLAVIGGGFSGISLSYHLLKLIKKNSIKEPLYLYLIEKDSFAEGPAYCTKSTSHILNVPAIAMSALYGEPHHFLAYAQSKDPLIKSSTFASRFLYGQYLKEVLKELEESDLEHFKFKKIQNEAVSLKRLEDRININFADGKLLEVDKVVIATGNYPPVKFCDTKDDFRYQNDPWDKTYPLLDNELDSLALIGTGLTMVDKVLELKSIGFKGQIYAVSRKGLLPEPAINDVNCFEFDYEIDPLIPEYSNPFFDFKNYKLPDELPKSVLGLYRLIRSEINRCKVLNIHHSCIFNAFLFRFIDFWQGVDEKEQRKFIRYLRPYWNIYAHKIPISSYDSVLDMIKEGKLKIKKGDVKGIEFTDTQVELIYKSKQGIENRLKVDRIINCSGPAVKPKDIDDRFIKNLIDTSIIQKDNWGLLLDSDELGRPRVDGMPLKDDIFILGSFKKGPLAATLPVPFIRQKTVRLAIKFLRDLGAEINDEIPHESLCEL